MELLYLWINRSPRKFIEKQGFNFSSEFCFNMKLEWDTWCLYKDITWIGKNSIFKSNVVENLTAVVGKNGAGKTTLLNYLFGLDCRISHKDSFGEGYEQLQMDSEEEDRCLFIIRENYKMKIFHNFKNGFSNKTEFVTIDMTDFNTYREYLLGHIGYKNITKVYLTNSNYSTPGVMSSDGMLDEVTLSPNSLSTISKDYYNKILGLEKREFTNDVDRKYRSIIKKQKDSRNFQQICDVVYFANLVRKGLFDSYLGKKSHKLGVFADFCGGIIDKEYPYFHQEDHLLTEESEITKRLYNVYWYLRKKYKNFLVSETPIFRVLLANLVFEVCIDNFECKWPESIDTYDEFLEWINLNEIDTKKEYYFQAMKEVEALREILQKDEKTCNNVPKDDLAYRLNIILDYEKNEKAYMEFLSFILDRFGNTNSFILRYIKIEGVEMSSGERAFQNFFSWMNLLPQFNNISDSIPPDLKDSVLVLIDELDLYLHPKWQASFIKNMISELEIQFADKKIQIVFSTHSPLCLSDVPNENTIYLSQCNGQAVCEDRRKHEQSFGRDIYTLLNDAFYLENCTMGTYSESFVNNIIETMYDKEKKIFKHLCEKEVFILNEKISYIGNEILNKKLKDMLLKCFDNKESKKKFLISERQKIDCRLAELENERW